MPPFVWYIISNFTTSKIGTGGMGFNWEAGNWGDMPKILVEAFQILESTIADHNESEQRKQEKSNRRISIRN